MKGVWNSPWATLALVLLLQPGCGKSEAPAPPPAPKSSVFERFDAAPPPDATAAEASADESGEKELPPAAASAPAWEPTTADPQAPAQAMAGSPICETTPYGKYYYYLPRQQPPSAVLVLVHGTLDKSDPYGVNSAEKFIGYFKDVALRRNLLLIAPCFDDSTYGGIAGPGGGYRGLWGRVIDADAFVNCIVDGFRYLFPNLDGRIYLFGHSAGGQFSSRYVVKHPERIVAAVISSPGTLAFPDPDTPWTDGMAVCKRNMQWAKDGPVRRIDYMPNSEGWIDAAQLPIAVIVGEQDVEHINGPHGSNHVERAQSWVSEMHRFAQEHGVPCTIGLVVVPKVGHNSRKLSPTAIRILFGER